MTRTRVFAVIGAVVILLASASGVMAQANHLQFYTINVKLGSEAQWMGLMRKIKEAADKTGAPQGWNTFQGALGTSNTNFYVTLGFETWGQRDLWKLVPEMLTEAFGEAEAQKILAAGSSTWDVATKVYSLDKERSVHLDQIPESGPFPSYLQVLLGQVKPEKVGEYEGLLARFRVAQEKHGNRINIRRTTRFGPSWEYYSVTPFERWGDWDAGTGFWSIIAKEYGEVEARDMQNRLRSCYESREIFVVRHLPELSRIAPSSTSN